MLRYHQGQIEVQEEANTRRVAEMLADWVGPVGEFAGVADLILLASQDEAGALRFAAISGRAPLIEVAGHSSIRIPGLPWPPNGESVLAGGLAISLAQLRRARINGRLTRDGDDVVLEAHEAFTNCRKYITPSVALEDETRSGPLSQSDVELESPWLSRVIERAQTSFLATVSPDGQPDVSHRGGAPGFLQLDASSGTLRWSEFIGDGMLKSAGNVRATGNVTLLVVDLESGDAAELIGVAEYRTLRTQKQARIDALEQHRERFPVQGEMTLQVARAVRLEGLFAPRRKLEKAIPVTSASSIDDQAPQ